MCIRDRRQPWADAQGYNLSPLRGWLCTCVSFTSSKLIGPGLMGEVMMPLKVNPYDPPRTETNSLQVGQPRRPFIAWGSIVTVAIVRFVSASITAYIACMGFSDDLHLRWSNVIPTVGVLAVACLVTHALFRRGLPQASVHLIPYPLGIILTVAAYLAGLLPPTF